MLASYVSRDQRDSDYTLTARDDTNVAALLQWIIQFLRLFRVHCTAVWCLGHVINQMFQSRLL